VETTSTHRVFTDCASASPGSRGIDSFSVDILGSMQWPRRRASKGSEPKLSFLQNVTNKLGMNGFPEYDSLDGVGLAGLVAKGEVSPAQLVDEAIRRIERWNPSLNAVVLRMYDHARRAATAADEVR